MFKVLIIGAGSIGNHLAFACRQKNWDVTMMDIDQKALDRTREMIYPSRYQKWDLEIKLEIYNLRSIHEDTDLVIIGTPPNSHIQIAYEVIKGIKPKVILIEKPLVGMMDSTKDLEKFNQYANNQQTKVLVGYNHVLTENTKIVESLIDDGFIGEPQFMEVIWREHWGGIFKAHPWLSGPQDSYLGDFNLGGGAGFEHSHGINIWQHFSRYLKKGKIKQFKSEISFTQFENLNYDSIFQLIVTSENGLNGYIMQDVITSPAQKKLTIQGTEGYIEWHANYDEGYDAVIYYDDEKKKNIQLIKKTRPDDFKNEINHIEDILMNNVAFSDSPIKLENAIETIKILHSVFF